jgi:hypothetical protein
LNPVPLLKPTALSSPLHQYDNIRRRKPSHTTWLSRYSCLSLHLPFSLVKISMNCKHF